MDTTTEIMDKVQSIMSQPEFVSSAVRTALEDPSFKEVLHETISGALDEQDVVVIINEADKVPEPSLDVGIKFLAVVGVVSTVYHGYLFGSKLLSKIK